mmetsp:Transcript_19166/g.55324  ORF Transcript_19166/g.55324 Transcript_19166/m.55324 type:complete len:329 (-) Transcript_19166:152-1138(-)
MRGGAQRVLPGLRRRKERKGPRRGRHAAVLAAPVHLLARRRDQDGPRAPRQGDGGRFRHDQGAPAAHRRPLLWQGQARAGRRRADQPARAVRRPLPAKVLPGLRREHAGRGPPLGALLCGEPAREEHPFRRLRAAAGRRGRGRGGQGTAAAHDRQGAGHDAGRLAGRAAPGADAVGRHHLGADPAGDARGRHFPHPGAGQRQGRPAGRGGEARVGRHRRRGGARARALGRLLRGLGLLRDRGAAGAGLGGRQGERGVRGALGARADGQGGARGVARWCACAHKEAHRPGDECGRALYTGASIVAREERRRAASLSTGWSALACPCLCL